MNIRLLLGPVALVAMLTTGTAAYAQLPDTKLTRRLSQNTVDAIWCSSLFLEESYYYDEGSDDSLYWEDMAYDLGDELDDVMREAGLPEAESEEIWAIFDDHAAEFAMSDEGAYLQAVEACDDAIKGNKIKLR